MAERLSSLIYEYYEKNNYNILTCCLLYIPIFAKLYDKLAGMLWGIQR
jgi:hypothetical protein